MRIIVLVVSALFVASCATNKGERGIAEITKDSEHPATIDNSKPFVPIERGQYYCDGNAITVGDKAVAILPADVFDFSGVPASLSLDRQAEWLEDKNVSQRGITVKYKLNALQTSLEIVEEIDLPLEHRFINYTINRHGNDYTMILGGQIKKKKYPNAPLKTFNHEVSCRLTK